MELNITNQKAIIEPHEGDMGNYQRMVKDIANEVGGKVVEKENNFFLSNYYEVLRDERLLARFLPIFNREEKSLDFLTVEVYDEEIIPVLEKGVNYLDNYPNLKDEGVDVYTYF